LYFVPACSPNPFRLQILLNELGGMSKDIDINASGYINAGDFAGH
jgi:hypothetical protein